jgi:phosphoribosylformylglycinamidine synthase
MAVIGNEAPDCEDPQRLRAFFAAIGDLRRAGFLLAYHDRSDGGLLATLAEMAFAGRCGLSVRLDADDPVSAVAELFTEELGAVIQVDATRVDEVRGSAGRRRVVRKVRTKSASSWKKIVSKSQRVRAWRCCRNRAPTLRAAWSETSYRLQALRDNPACAAEERARTLDPQDPGLFARLSFDPADDVAAPYVQRGARPEVAILREQGVNSQLEMAAVFDRAGFRPADVHMTDLIAGRTRLDRFKGLVACGGFSYGDVLGAGEGWAKSILFNPACASSSSSSLGGHDSFSLGVCNGCQMMAALKPFIPGAAHWPRFVRNRSEQFEGRFGLVEVLPTPSIFHAQAWRGPSCRSPFAHGEGLAEFSDGIAAGLCIESGLGEHALGGQLRARCRRLPREPERLAGRHHGPHDGRRSRDDPDAASRAGLPHRAEFVAPGRVGRRGRLAADVPQRAGSLRLGTRRAGLLDSRAARPIGVILSSVSSAKNRRTIIACCSLPLRT